VVLSNKKSLASVSSPASEGKGVQEGDVDVQDVVWRDHPACLCVFSRHRELQIGPVFGQDQAVLRRLTLGGRIVRTFFAATSPNVRELRVINGRFQAKSQDDSLFPISQVSASSAWARDSETLLTPDCAAAATGPGPVITSYQQVITSNLQGHVDINLQSTAPSLLGSLCRVTVVPFRPAHQTGKQDGYPTNLDRLTYFQTHGELHKGPCTFSLPGTNNLPRHLCTPAATSYLRFIMDAQRPWPHFVQLNGLPDQMPEVAKDRERLEVSLPSSKCFAEAHASSIWAVSSAPAGPAIVGFYHFFLTPAVTPDDSTPGFSTPASPAEVDHGFLRIPGACYVAVDNRKAEAERDLDNGALVLRYLHMGHN